MHGALGQFEKQIEQKDASKKIYSVMKKNLRIA